MFLLFFHEESIHEVSRRYLRIPDYHRCKISGSKILEKGNNFSGDRREGVNEYHFTERKCKRSNFITFIVSDVSEQIKGQFQRKKE